MTAAKPVRDTIENAMASCAELRGMKLASEDVRWLAREVAIVLTTDRERWRDQRFIEAMVATHAFLADELGRDPQKLLSELLDSTTVIPYALQKTIQHLAARCWSDGYKRAKQVAQ